MKQARTFLNQTFRISANITLTHSYSCYPVVLSPRLINGLARENYYRCFHLWWHYFFAVSWFHQALYNVATKIKPIKINLTEYATIDVGRYLQFLPLETHPTYRSNAVLAAISQGRSSLNIN